MGRSEPSGPGFLLTLLITGALAACTSATGTDLPTAPAATEPTATEEPTSPATPSDPPTEISDEEAVAALWESVHTIRIDQTYSEEAVDRDAFAGLTTQESASSLLDLVELGRGDIALVSTASEFWPEVAIAPSGREATISDCILVATRPANDPQAEVAVRSRVWSGTAALTDDGWLLDRVSIDQDNCVPTALNQQLLAAYETYHHVRNEAWDPPDPDHAQLAEVMVGQRLENFRALLERHRQDGIVVRDPHDPRAKAVVFALGIGTATVSDCHPAHAEYGAYDLESGERLDDVIPPVEPEQRNLVSVDLVRTEGGTWKVEQSGGLDKSNCTPRGTDYVLAP